MGSMSPVLMFLTGTQLLVQTHITVEISGLGMTHRLESIGHGHAVPKP